MTPEEFRRLRDNRTQSCERIDDYQSASVAIIAGKCAETEDGQMMIITASSLFARFCHKIDVLVPDAICLLRPYGKGKQLHEVIRKEVLSADPWAELGLGEQLQSNHTYVLQIGGTVTGNLIPDFSIDSNGWVACASQGAVNFNCNHSISNLVGAAQAAIIGVTDGFKVATSQPGKARVSRAHFSTFYCRLLDDTHDEAPALATGMPISLGNLFVVGAGAVGSNILHFLKFFPISDTSVTVIDHDTVDYSNLNRCLAFGYNDVGISKSAATATMLSDCGVSATAFTGRFDQYMECHKLDADIIVPVANEYQVRWAIQNNLPPLMLQASTGRAWTVNVGRHIPVRDFCLSCSFPEVSDAHMACGSGTISDSPDKEADAALPFVSPWAAILVVAELAKLQFAGYPFSKSRLSVETYGPLHTVEHFQGQKLQSCICAGMSEALFHKIRGKTRFADLSFSPTSVGHH
ncbi:MAG: ThiF family adenylyltransferase [Armatimonadetes bacterium]|nr:ThiF family adenylyltransferase [Armatimonadota bacterium]